MDSALRSLLLTLQTPILVPSDLDPFFEKYPLGGLLVVLFELETKKNKPDLKLLLEFLDKISRDQKYSALFMLLEKETIERMLKSENSSIRTLLIQAMMQHPLKVSQHLHEDESGDILLVLFYILSDPEAEIGLKALKLLQNLEISLLMRPEVMKKMEFGLENSKDVVKMRIMELIVELSAKNQAFFAVSKPLLERSFRLFNTKDLLLKLNIVEIVAKLGDSEWSGDFIVQHEFLQDLIKEAFEDNSEFYIRKYVVLLLSKLVGRGKLDLTLKTRKNLVIFTREALEASSKEENEGGIEVMGNLMQTQRGIELFLKEKEILATFFSFSRSANANLKKKCLHSLAGVFRFDKNKPEKVLRGLFALMAGEGAGEEEVKLKNAMNGLFSMLYSPFADIEIEALYVLKEIIKYNFGLHELTCQPKALDYLLVNFAKTKEIFDEKRELNIALQQLLKSDTKDPIISEFAKKYREQLAMQVQGSSVVYYKTEAND